MLAQFVAPFSFATNATALRIRLDGLVKPTIPLYNDPFKDRLKDL